MNFSKKYDEAAATAAANDDDVDDEYERCDLNFHKQI